MSFASNLAALARLLTATATGIVNAKAPAAGDNSTALVNSAWFKSEAAAEANAGTAKVATQAQTVAGADDTTIVTPKKLRAGFAWTFAQSGYIALPSWLGGLIFQWGMAWIPGSALNVAMTLPVAFPNAGLTAFATDTGSSAFSYGAAPSGKTQVVIYGAPYIVTTGSLTAKGATAMSAFFFVIGW